MRSEDGVDGLADVLRRVDRRYRLPALLPADRSVPGAHPATALAHVIEAARLAMEGGAPAAPALAERFVAALAGLIGHAMHPTLGDGAYQAQVLGHRPPPVQALLERQGPRSGSAEAAAHGALAQQRGAAVEAQASRALNRLAERLNARTATDFRVAHSLRVPAALVANVERAKGEWDVALLREADRAGDTSHWDVCLLLEAKASVDGATTDIARLLRGLDLFGRARVDAVYRFPSGAKGATPLHLRGAALQALAAKGVDPGGPVLYVTDAPADAAPRLLGPDSRMQLLTAAPSLAYARALAEDGAMNLQALSPLWQSLMESPRWHGVLHQYPRLRAVRERMVHIADLEAAIAAA